MELSKEQKSQLIERQLLNVAVALYEIELSHGSFVASGDDDMADGAKVKMDKLALRQKWLEGQLSALQ